MMPLSRTSILVAAARAYGALDPDPSVRNPDWLAEHLLGPEEVKLLAGHPLEHALTQDYREAGRDPQIAGFALLMIIRTRFIDERLLDAIRNGATQVVILGAGFDSRAYRLREKFRGAKVFEIDSQDTQALKRQRVEAVLGCAPSGVVYVPVDFNHDDLGESLRQAGFRSEEKSVFTWEGVSMYLEEASARRTLATIAAISAPGTTLMMDFSTNFVLEIIKHNPDLPAFKQLNSWGEPWKFGLPDGAEREFFAELGFETKEMFGIYNPDSVVRYATRKDGTMFGLTPGMPRAFPSQSGAGATAAAISQRGSSLFYALAELSVAAPRQ